MSKTNKTAETVTLANGRVVAVGDQVTAAGKVGTITAIISITDVLGTFHRFDVMPRAASGRGKVVRVSAADAK